MIGFNRKNKIVVRKIFILVVFLIGFNLHGCSYPTLGNESCSLDLDSRSWRVLNDSGWPGGSAGYIQTLDGNNRRVRFKYNLKATELWPWPEIDFFVEFERLRDLTKYRGVQLYIKGEKRQELYFYFLTKDKNIEILKLCWQRFILTTKYQKIYLPFSQFKIAKDWTPRHLGFNPFIEG